MHWLFINFFLYVCELQVGPAGSQFGLLACLFVEVIHCWQMLQRPGRATLRLMSVVVVLFLIGLLPWVDNYSHLFGFIFGFLLSFALLPFVSFGTYDRTTKVIMIWVCLLVVISLFFGLVILFYVHPIYECDFCKYFNCIPFTKDICADQDIKIVRTVKELWLPSFTNKGQSAANRLNAAESSLFNDDSIERIGFINIVVALS